MLTAFDRFCKEFAKRMRLALQAEIFFALKDPSTKPVRELITLENISVLLVLFVLLELFATVAVVSLSLGLP